MATLNQVMTALADLAEEAIYPNGTGNPSVAGVDVSIFPGWPVKAEIDSQMKLGNVMVSIFPMKGATPSSLLGVGFSQTTVNDPNIVATVDDVNSITITGTPTADEVVMAVYNRVGYAYKVLSGDTLDDIAAGVAAALPSATSLANVVTVTGAFRLAANIVTQGISTKVTDRQVQRMMIVVWAPTFTLRDLVYAPIQSIMSDEVRLPLPGGISGNMFYAGMDFIDDFETHRIYRANLYYKIDYANTITKTATTIGVVETNIAVENQ